MTLYNNQGMEVQKLVNGEMAEGTHITQVDGSALTSGVYYYRIKSGNYTNVKKMLVVK
jgi:hypothetical protein